MNHTIKRFLLGLSTILFVGVAYAKGNGIPMPKTQPVTSKNLNEAQTTTKTLKSDVQAMSQQVVELQKKIKDEASKNQSTKEHLKVLQSKESSMKADAIAVVQQKLLIAEQTARAAALAQASATRSSPPPVQTTTKASGGDDSGGDD